MDDSRRSGIKSKYLPLVRHVCDQDETRLIFTFTAIAAILGFPLPTSAHVDRRWWTNANRSYVRAWTTGGWRARLDFPTRTVQFVRDPHAFDTHDSGSRAWSERNSAERPSVRPGRRGGHGPRRGHLRTMIVHLSVETIRALDAAVAERQANRSAFVREVVTDWLIGSGYLLPME